MTRLKAHDDLPPDPPPDATTPDPAPDVTSDGGATAKAEPSAWDDSSWADQPSGSTPTDPADVVVQPPPEGMTSFPYLRTNDPDRVDVILKLDPDTQVVTHVVVPLPNVGPGERVRYENHDYGHEGEVSGGQWIFVPMLQPTHPIELPPAADARKKPSEHNPKAAANARRVGTGEG